MARVFTLEQIQSVFSSSSAYTRLINQIERGFVDYSSHCVYVAPVVHLGSTDSSSSIPRMMGGGDVCLKAGYIADGSDRHYVVKIAGGGFVDAQNKQNYRMLRIHIDVDIGDGMDRKECPPIST